MRAQSSLLPLTAAAALLLDPPSSALVLLALALWSLKVRAGAAERAVLAVGLLVAALLQSGNWFSSRFDIGDEGWRARAEDRFVALLDDLEGETEVAAEALAEAISVGSRLEVFEEIRALASAPENRQRSYLLYDPDGEAVAWGGVGLLHDPAPFRAATAGSDFVSSYRATTLYSQRPLGTGPRRWWVLVGTSFSHERLPFAAPGSSSGDYRWTLVRDGEAGGWEGARLASGRGFDLSIQASLPPGDRGQRGGRWAAAVLGFTLLVGALVGSRSLGRVPTSNDRTASSILVMTAAGAGCLARAGGAGGAESAALVLGVLLFAASLHFGSRAGSIWSRLRLLLAASLPLAFALLFQGTLGARDLGSTLFGDGSLVALRAVTALVAFVALLDLSVVERSTRFAGWALPASFALVFAAGAVHDNTVVAVALLLAAGATSWAAMHGRGGSQDRAFWLAATVLAAMLGAVSWELVYRYELREGLAAGLEPATLPRASQVELVARDLDSFLRGPVPEELLRSAPNPQETSDLAIAIWQRSPVARRGVLSALEVVGPGVGSSLFSYGMAVRDGTVDPGSLPVESRGLWTSGETALAGETGLVVHFWVAPAAGPSADAAGVDDLELDLLRGQVPGSLGGEALPGGAVVAVYSTEGAPLRFPWGVAVPLENAPAGKVDTPSGPAWSWSAQGEGVIYSLFLPRLGPIAGLERIGVHAVGNLILFGFAGALAVLFSLSRESFRERARTVFSSYPRKLLVVLTILLVVPLLLLNLVLFRALGDRLEAEHREAGEVALSFAQKVLSDYLLALEPGFGVRAVLEQEILDWLAQVVDREIHVYWGSQFFASSRPALFAAGLLPARIPGAVFSDLALRKAKVAARTRDTGPITYLELYAPLELPDFLSRPERGFYLSTPLVAQEEEVSGQLATLSRQAFLVTTGLLFLLVAVGARLAAGFTRPVMEIVEGTDRIARGDSSLGLTPSAPELQALVTAIDEMATRIAQGRRDLLREKRVVEQVVENITSGVISLDHQRRVLMQNRVAGALLASSVGDDIDAVASAAGFSDLGEFLIKTAESEVAQNHRLRLPGTEGLEWSVLWVPVPGGGDPAALLVIEDVTEILRGQRLEAWAEMARIIAHEVKNPLTPIRLSTEHMQQVFETDPERFEAVFERCTKNILTQVDELREIAAEFSTYSRVPAMDLRQGDLIALAASVVEGYLTAPPPGVTVSFEAEIETAPARFDSKLLSRALRNLLENAVRASRDDGEVRVRVVREEGNLVIEVADRGPGVTAEDLERIFDPYFSTHDTGTGLGLPIARRIVDVHGGSIGAANRLDGGLAVRVILPLSESDDGS